MNDINEVNNEGVTPLAFACKLHNTDIIKLLCDNNAKPELKALDAQSALEIALQERNESVLRILYYAYYQ